MSATPHNGKQADFEPFMAPPDGDRFEGRYRDGMHHSDPSDMMRRLTKEELVTFAGRKLFPERRAYTVKYRLSDDEGALYAAVTSYVRDEMNRADRLEDGDGKRRQNVGFALQTLQRRLASSSSASAASTASARPRSATCGTPWPTRPASEVYTRPLEKLAQAREALGGRVPSTCSAACSRSGRPRELALEAVRHGDDPARARPSSTA
ncbi:MAG: hypothetical protein U1E52_02105 [Geminicoccaceae bacterium]